MQFVCLIRLLENHVSYLRSCGWLIFSVVNIAATALVTEAATAIFGEAGVSAATGLMTVRLFCLSVNIL